MPTMVEQLRALSEDYKAGILTREEFDAAKADLMRSESDPGKGAATSGPTMPSPERIAEYRVLRRLGAGGMGTVYLAENMIEGLARDEGRVAVKVIHSQLVSKPGIRERFLAEARISTEIRHPNLVRVHRYLPDHDALVMEYVEGATLATVLARGRPDWEAAVSAFQGVLAAVAAFHDRRPPIVHRDLKPGNIMVSSAGLWKVMDFGLARDLGGVGVGTSSSGALGTLAYMPPEQAARPKEVDPRWDVYALGLVLWEILTGSAAWRQVDSGYQLLKDKEQDKALDLASVPEGVPMALIQVALTACRGDPRARHAHAGPMRNALELAFQKALMERNLLDSVPRPEAPRGGANLAGQAKPRAAPAPRPEPTRPTPEPPRPTSEPPRPTPEPPRPTPEPPRPMPEHPRSEPFEAELPLNLPEPRRSVRMPLLLVVAVAGSVAIIALAVTVSRTPAVTQAPTLSQVPTVARPPSAGIDWVSIPGGSFQMGSEDGDSDEKPVHTVALRAFEISRTEVTVDQYKACVDAGACKVPGTDRTCTWGVPGQKQHPVNCVDWNQASAFVRWAGGRLPTEAEWEYAANAGQKTVFSGSNDVDEVAWYVENAGAETLPVGQKKPNAWGLYDMSGNVGEWTQDWYGPYTAGSASNPTGPTSGSVRVLRGGSCGDSFLPNRVAMRGRLDPNMRFFGLGIRVVR